MFKFKKVLISTAILTPITFPIASVSCANKQHQTTWSATIINDKEDGFILSNNVVIPNKNYSAYIQSKKFVFDNESKINVKVNNLDVDFRAEVDESQPTILYIDINKKYVQNDITIFIDVHSMQYSASITNTVADGYTLISPNVIKHKNYSSEIICNTPLEPDFVTSVKIDDQDIPYSVEISSTDNKKATIQVNKTHITGDIQITLKHPEVSWAISNGLSAIIAKQGTFGESGDFVFYYNGSKISKVPISITLPSEAQYIFTRDNLFYWTDDAAIGDYSITLTAHYGDKEYTAPPMLFSIKQEVDFCTDTWDEVCSNVKKGIEGLKQTYKMPSFVGLTRKIQIGEMGEYDVRVIGQDHDIIRTEGSSLIKAALTFELEQILPEDKIFSERTSVNNGYWYTNQGGCYLYNYINENIFPLLPNVLQQSITSVLKESCTNRDTGEITAFKQKLWIPSATELFGNDHPQYWCEEGFQYEYYDMKHGHWQNKLLKHKLNIADFSSYWIRSIVYDQVNVDTLTYYIDEKEHAMTDDIDSSLGAIFAFCL